MDAENFVATDESGSLHRVVRPIVKLSPTHNAANLSFVDSPMSSCPVSARCRRRNRNCLPRFRPRSRRIAAVGTVGQRAGVNGVHKFDAAKSELATAAVIERMDFRRAFLVEPGGNLVIGNHRRAGAFGDFHRVTDVVAVPVRNKDEIRRHCFHVNVLGEWIPGDKRVEQSVLPPTATEKQA